MSKTVSVMTYNVHSCIGMDGKAAPLRIAEVIDRCNPDLVALQELDLGLARTSLIDQAHVIATALNMSYHFHSSIRLEEGGYGNAVLSRFPLRLIKAGPVPTTPCRECFERRGALWVEIEAEGGLFQMLATHFGLNRAERLAQAEAIVGPEWLGHPDCRTPVLLCGDFNALPGSGAYRRITSRLRDGQRLARRLPWPTWPVRLPFMCIDYVFVSSEVRVVSVAVPRNPLTRVASDHFPLLVTVELP
ncbi:endonuclease/exonuclease/phosphatase family protein [Geomesophilobacter sediminis]|uniref:Endonuclease/exonuclease/phosphatase family protein n=1 Tax=Geomesophilobacter sediminis TaxID=2798584 RepID=A0A8J7S6M3_9BACT|nr:endonuclease/exonuclease/phosphatase family protein [Geomesophilobacter sediminis]MBJ6726487.1 endonuclease/exonuclease/phosphatase family protein [Geomesophilobacter sediminis]